MTLAAQSLSTKRTAIDASSVSAIIFDIGGVFLYPHYSRVWDSLGRTTQPVASELQAFRRAHHAGCLALASLDSSARERDPDFWSHYDQAYADSLGVDIARVKKAIRTSWDWPHEQNIAAFHRLAAAGQQLAIVSNNNGTAPEQMRDHGVCQVLSGGPLPQVAAIIDSSLVGVAKPDPMIMAPALYALDVDPSRALYVGDTVHADVAGANAAGMQVVQLDPFDQHVGFDHPRVRDLDELAAIILDPSGPGA